MRSPCVPSPHTHLSYEIYYSRVRIRSVPTSKKKERKKERKKHRWKEHCSHSEKEYVRVSLWQNCVYWVTISICLALALYLGALASNTPLGFC